jgi:hypothetical protein
MRSKQFLPLVCEHSTLFKSYNMSNNANQSNKGTLVELLEWAYDVKLSDEQQITLVQELVAGLTNTDQSEIDLINSINTFYTEMVNHPNKGDARLYFNALFYSARFYSSDKSRILTLMHKIIEEHRPGITELNLNPLSDNLDTDNELTGETKASERSTETPFNSLPKDFFQSGIYRGFKFESYSGPIFSESGMYASYFTFYSDGKVLYGHPDTDMADIRGSYRVKDKVVDITWSDGGKVLSPIDADGSVTFYNVRYSFFQNLF